MFLNDRPTYAVNFQLSYMPKNILVDILARPLIDLFPSNFHRLKNLFYVPVSVSEVKRTLSLQKRVNDYQRSRTMQDRLNGLATLSINCEMKRKLDFTTIIHDFAYKSQENVSLVHTK